MKDRKDPHDPMDDPKCRDAMVKRVVKDVSHPDAWKNAAWKKKTPRRDGK